MSSVNDLWYIRLPDGRVLRARGTDQLRRILKSGRVPWESRVRRTPEDAWQGLDRTPEFADLVPADEIEPEEKAAPAPRAKSRSGSDLRTLGVRGLVDELCNAFDSSLQHTKLVAAACTGLGMGVTVVIGDGAVQLMTRVWEWPAYAGWIGYLVTALILLGLFNLCSSILTQMTALELSRFRPAEFSEIRSGILGYTVRLTCAVGLIGGFVLGLIILLRQLPNWLPTEGGTDPALETLVNLINGMRLILEVLAGPIIALALLLLGPIYVVEDFSLLHGLREWIGMLRKHLGPIYVYQAIAFGFATFMTLPLLAPVLIAFGMAGGNPREFSLGESIPFFLLVGVALTPMFAYLLVAHVFIYLNLRYEFFYSARER